MPRHYMPEFPFHTEKDLVRISEQINLYIITRNWADLANGSLVMKEIILDCFMGAVAGEFLSPNKQYSKSLWDFRELTQTTNCVRLGAEHFARREKRGAINVPQFRGGEDLLKDIQVAYETGKCFNAFLAAARGLLPCMRTLENENVQSAFAKSPEKLMPDILVIQQKEKEILKTLRYLTKEIIKQKIQIDAEDAIAVFKEVFPGIDEKAMKKIVGNSYRLARQSPRF